MKKLFISGITAMAVLLSVGAAACGNGNKNVADDDASAAHTSHEWTLTSKTSATCGEAGREYYSCSCGAVKSVRTAEATGQHAYGDDNVCDDCGYIDMSGLSQEEAEERYGFFFTDTDSSGTYTTGDVVSFGNYPQTLIADDALYGAFEDALPEGTQMQGVKRDNEVYALLEEQKGTLPTDVDGGDWTSYGYYDSGETSDYMFYRDVTVNGVGYRGVYMLDYRPYYSKLGAGEDYSYIDDEGYALGEVYWFEYEPISWTVLDYENGNLLLNSVYCLEAQPYQALYEGGQTDLVIPGTDTCINDWEASTIRSFLNGDFYNLAFSESERQMIQTVTLDNANTGYSADSRFQISQGSTQDKVFLLAYQDLINTDYGFTEKVSYDIETNGDKINSVPEAMTRRRSYTAYSTIQGLRTSEQGVTADGYRACWYMLRSAGNSRYSITGVNKYGSLVNTASGVTGTSSSDGLGYNGDLGVLPSICLKVGR